MNPITCLSSPGNAKPSLVSFPSASVSMYSTSCDGSLNKPVHDANLSLETQAASFSLKSASNMGLSPRPYSPFRDQTVVKVVNRQGLTVTGSMEAGIGRTTVVVLGVLFLSVCLCLGALVSAPVRQDLGREKLGVLSALNTRELRIKMLKAGFDRGETLALHS